MTTFKIYERGMEDFDDRMNRRKWRNHLLSMYQNSPPRIVAWFHEIGGFEGMLEIFAVLCQPGWPSVRYFLAKESVQSFGFNTIREAVKEFESLSQIWGEGIEIETQITADGFAVLFSL